MNSHLKALTEQRDQLPEERDEISKKLSGLASEAPSENRSEAIGRLNRKLEKVDDQLAHSERDVQAEQEAEQRERFESIAAARRGFRVNEDDDPEPLAALGPRVNRGARVNREPLTYEMGSPHGFFPRPRASLGPPGLRGRPALGALYAGDACRAA